MFSFEIILTDACQFFAPFARWTVARGNERSRMPNATTAARATSMIKREGGRTKEEGGRERMEEKSL